MNEQEMKVCGQRLRPGGRKQTFKACGKLLPISAFPLVRTWRDQKIPSVYCKDCYNLYRLDWEDRKGPEYKKYRMDRKRARRKEFLMKLQMVKPKPNSCEICGRKRRLVIDHNHETGMFRGWLCRMCNTAEGLLGSRDAVVGLLKYIDKMAQMNFLAPDVSWPSDIKKARNCGPIRNVNIS